MDLRTIGGAVAAGFAAFLVVFAAVSELLRPHVEFSVLVGIPAGLLAGAAATAVVLTRSGGGRTGGTLAAGLRGFGVVLVVAFVAALAAGATVTAALVGATAVGVVGGVAAALARRSARWGGAR